jgi:UDP-glucose 4-epimerase
LTPALSDPIVTLVHCDITSHGEIRKLVEGVDVVVHTAALLSRDAASDLRRAYDVNVAGTFGLIEASANAAVKKFIFTSSSGVYDGRHYETPVRESHAFDPASMYGVGKAAGEMFLMVFGKAQGLHYVALRCAAIYGIRQSRRSNSARVIPDAFDRIESGLAPQIPGDGSQAYDFIDVVDVARAHIAAITSPVTGEAFNLASGILTPVKDVVQRIADIAGASERPVHAEQEKRHLIPVHTFDVTKAERMLGFRATTTLDEGLKNYFRWRQTIAKT